MLEKLKGKRLLILGGIKSMIEVVDIAHRYGIYVLVTDYLEDSPAKKVADASFMVNAIDTDAVANLCKEQKVDGILTGHVDMLLPYYAEICEKTGLPCYGTGDLFKSMTDKVEFKNICLANGVPTIPEYKYEDNEKIKYPVLIKPADSSGSRGITICNNNDELKAGIEKALSFSKKGEYLIEKYMTGEEIVMYYYFQDGNPIFMGMCDRYVNKEQKGVAQVSTAYVFPSKYTSNHLKFTNQKYLNMLKKIGVPNGTMFLQGFADENSLPCVYEPGYRLNGAREQYIYSETTGIHATELLINFALTGKMADYDINSKADPYMNGKYGCMLSTILNEGRIARIEGVEKAKKISGLKKLVLINEENDTITSKSLGTLAQIGYRAYIVADTVTKLKKYVDEVLETIIYYNENNESMMLEPFDSNELLKNYM